MTRSPIERVPQTAYLDAEARPTLDAVGVKP
jgi:hypothetical protein